MPNRRTLVFCKLLGTKGPLVEVHTLASAAGWAAQPIVHCPIPLADSDHYDFALAGQDLVAVHRQGTRSGRVEVNLFSPRARYQQPLLRAPSGLTVEQGEFYDFYVAGRDLVALTNTNTGSGKVDIHIFTATSQYQRQSLITGTPIEMAARSNYDFALAGRDLMAIRRVDPESGYIEVNVLAAGSNYQHFRVVALTPIPAVGSEDYQFATCGKDLVAIRAANTDSGFVELQVVSAESGYAEISEYIITGLALGDGEGGLVAGFFET